jgi:hypothetical protein
MNEEQIKIKIFLIQAVDWSLLIAVFSIGIYCFFDPENRGLMTTIALVGLFLVNRLGQFTINKIAALRADMSKLQRLQKQDMDRLERLRKK